MIVNETLPVIFDPLLGGLVGVVASTALIVMYVHDVTSQTRTLLISMVLLQLLRDHPSICMYPLWASHRCQHGLACKDLDPCVGEKTVFLGVVY